MSLLKQSHLDSLADENLEPLVRATELGTAMDFSQHVKEIKRARDLLNALNRIERVNLPRRVRDAAPNRLEALLDYVAQISAWTPDAPGAADLRAAILDNVRDIRDWAVENVRPYLRVDEAAATAMLAKAEKATAEAEALSAELRELAERLQVDAGEAATSELSGHYKSLADDFGAAADRYFKAVLASAAAVVLLIGIFLVFGPESRSDGTDWAALISGVWLHIVALGLASWALVFTARGYRNNRHLQVVNEQKRAALDTYNLFAAAVATPEERDVVTAELVRAVFAHPDTGFVDGSADRTIVENQTSLLGLLLRSQGPGSQG